MEELWMKVRTAFKSAFAVDPRTIRPDMLTDDVPARDSMGHGTLASSLEPTFGLSLTWAT